MHVAVELLRWCHETICCEGAIIMGIETSGGNEFESFRQQFLGKSSDELSDLVIERFDEEFPPVGLFAGGFRDRVWQFVRNRVRAACDKSGQLGVDVWTALNDDHTAHNVERFALVCGFLAANVLHVHWPLHEIAAFALLIIATRPKGGGAI